MSVASVEGFDAVEFIDAFEEGEAAGGEAEEAGESTLYDAVAAGDGSGDQIGPGGVVFLEQVDDFGLVELH